MLINYISLKNFRQYKDTNTIRFSTDPEKNVTVITGENTCGKTTLVQSFIWCLYGHADFKDKKVLNAEVAEEMKYCSTGARKEASVKICLSHSGRNYLVERKEIYKVEENRKIVPEKSFKIYEIDSNGNTQPPEKADNDAIISDILPENLSDYFFFWGERIEKLSERKELSSAVKQFLGLDTMAAAIKHLTTAVYRLTKDGANGTNDADIEKCNKRLKELEQLNKDIDIQIESCRNNIEYYKEKASDLYAELTTSENKELQSRQNEYKNKLEILKQREKELEKAKTSFSRKFNDPDNYVYYYANLKEKKAVELLEKNPESTIGWNYIDINVINEILRKHKCICGNEFCDGDETHAYLIDQRKLVAPNVVGGVINSFVEESKRRKTFNQNYYELIHNDFQKISSLNDEIDDLNFDINNLYKYITGKADMKEKSRRYEDYLNKIREFERTLGEKTEDKKRNDVDIDRLNKNVILLMEKNKKYQKHFKAINYAQKVLDIFKEDYSKNEINLKSKLENYINKNFEEVYSGDRRIMIDEKYNAVALNKVGDNWISSETSPGLETVKNFAFIAGLVQCAKEKIIGADGTETEANENLYPLVLDAPFSQADEKHVPAISKLISKNAEQIILVVMKKDWNYAKGVLSDKVGKSYILEKVTETHTLVKEVE